MRPKKIRTLVKPVTKAWRLATLLILGFAFWVWSWSMPAQAATRITPKLEEQVLQILRDHPDVIMQSVEAYQQKQGDQLRQVQQAFVQTLKTNPKIVIAESPTTGAAESKVVLVEFSDFQCPYCAQAHKTLKQFMAKHQGEVTLVYKHLPLVQAHPQAMPAAKAAWAASQQGKFWEYQDALFTQQDKLGEEFYVATAKSLNLDLEKFESDRNSETAKAAIQKDIELAQVLGVGGTPFFVMNDETFAGAVQLTDFENVLGRVSKVS